MMHTHQMAQHMPQDSKLRATIDITIITKIDKMIQLMKQNKIPQLKKIKLNNKLQSHTAIL